MLNYVVVSDAFATPWLLCPWSFPGKNTGVGCHFLLHEIFPIQGLNSHLLYWEVDSLPLNHQGSPINIPLKIFFLEVELRRI